MPPSTITPVTTPTLSPTPPITDELECKICYQRYNVHNRRPKILDCLHRVCARCLNKILDTGTSWAAFPAPSADTKQRSANTRFLELRPRGDPHPQEPVLHLPSLHSSNCLVITIMEVQRDTGPGGLGSSDHFTEHSLDSISVGSNGQEVQEALSKLCSHVPRILVWLLGLFYFGSLPLGIYLLVIQRVTLGIVCVSLVPSSLTVCLVYGFCQCLCQGMCDCSPV
uniref:Zinc finger C3HC4 RING-type domain-containing protein n=1 Tax=Oncorhynchus tshawytscha TaxID=74940 RepID=A0AAZ3NV89_ONCTS